jgi:hypothetical protein
MRKLALAAALALVAPACTSAADDAGESASSDLTADFSIRSVCATDSNTALNRTGVIYVALCAGTQPSAEIQRVDLLSGTRTTIGQYPAGQRVTFHDVSADTALWSAGPANPVPVGTARPKSQVSFWTAGIGVHSFVPDDVLVNTDYHPSDEAPFQMLGYAGHGRILAIWGRIHPRVGLVDASSGTLGWNADGPPSSTISSYVSALRSTDGDRWLFGQTLVDVGGASPRVVRLADSIRAQPVYTGAGDTASWDGKSAFALLDGKTYGLVDLDTFVQTKLGDAASTDPLKPGRPTAASDGTIAFLTVSSDHTKRSLQTVMHQREVPSTFQGIEYLAPGGSWAIVAEKPASADAASHHWVVDLAHPEAAMVQLDDGGRVTLEESHGVLTLTTPIGGQHTLVRRIDAEGNASAPVDVAGSVLPLDSDRLLVNGCSSTFDGANVATDASRCLGADQRTQPIPLADTDRALVRGGTWSDITLSVVRL